MAITQPAAGLLTYEDYLTEGLIQGRYDIIEGVRVFMPGPTWRHQRIFFNTHLALHEYETASGAGLALSAPSDLLIRRVPRLQSRQPDVLFITNETLARGGGVPEKGPHHPRCAGYPIGPELVVEIISDSETERLFEEKLADYVAIGVKECWRPWPDSRTVDVLSLAAAGALVAATY